MTLKIIHTCCCLIIVCSMAMVAFSCKPLIHSYSVQPMMITEADSVFVNWSVRGQATLLTQTVAAVNDADSPQPETREYTLVVRKKGKEVKRTVIVEVRAVQSADDILFNTIRHGDTLIAEGEKDTVKWGHHFLLKTVSATGNRELTVMHGDRTAILKADGLPSVVFNGLSNSGKWEIMCLLTSAEKQDSTKIPGRLRIQTTLLYTK